MVCNKSKAGGKKMNLNQKFTFVESKRKRKATQGETSNLAINNTENEECISLVLWFKKKNTMF